MVGGYPVTPSTEGILPRKYPKEVQGLILDFGCVISLPQDKDVYPELARLLGQPQFAVEQRYWEKRDAYDRGALSAAAYWQYVSGDPRALEEGLVATLNRLDATSWSHQNEKTILAAKQAQEDGWKLALLSNMPREVWTELQVLCPWLPGFDFVTISGHLGFAKPDAAIYTHTVKGLGTAPENTTFWDDRQENIDAAAALGIRARLFVPGRPLPTLD